MKPCFRYGKGKMRLYTGMGVTLLLAVGSTQSAQAITFLLDWEGVAGYSAQGTFSYDETTAPLTFTEQGAGPTNVLNSLSLSFFDPNHALIASYAPVVNGKSNYAFLDFSFDTQSRQLFDAFDVGKADDEEGDTSLFSPNGNLVALVQFNTITGNQVIDFSFNGIGVQAVPEPGSLAVMVSASLLGAGWLIRKWRR